MRHGTYSQMSAYKISGHCTLCDTRCFDILGVYESHERLPGEPKALGAPVEGAMRVTFMLIDGSKTALTFCAECSKSLPSELYLQIWRKNIRSWLRELSEKPESERNPEWFQKQFSNGLLCEMGRIPWTEAVKNG